MRSRIDGVRATAVRNRPTSTTSTPIPITPEVCPIVRRSGANRDSGARNGAFLHDSACGNRCPLGFGRSGAPVVGGVGDRLDQEVDDRELGEAAVVEGTLG